MNAIPPIRRVSVRQQQGAILAIVMLTLSLILIPLFAAGMCLFSVTGTQSKQRTAVEAAALAAASALPSIVINDPNFGYVSLSDHPPVSKSTLAADGKPLPVLGINTIIATTRYNMIVAEQLNNSTLRSLAQRDAAFCTSAVESLVRALEESCSAIPKKRFALDIDGKPVDAFAAAEKAYLSNCSAHSRKDIRIFKLTLGWLEGRCNSNVNAPVPLKLAQLPRNCTIAGNYPAYVNLPVGNQDFCFAALSPQASLVENKRFRETQRRNKPCSVVRVTVENNNSIQERNPALHCTEACAQPYAKQDLAAYGSLVLNFPHGLPGQVLHFADLLSFPFDRNRICASIAREGDFPVDKGSSLVAGENDSAATLTVSSVFAQGLFDWLRTTHGAVHLDSVLSLLQCEIRTVLPPLKTSQRAGCVIICANKRGTLQTCLFSENPLSDQVIHDRQLYVQSFGALKDIRGTWMLKFRDQTYQLGTTIGGKHAGQLMPFHTEVATAISRYHPTIASFNGSSAEISGTFGSALFDCNATTRECFSSGGLAAEFELSSPILNGDSYP